MRIKFLSIMLARALAAILGCISPESAEIEEGY
jgi:hypothetical protein